MTAALAMPVIESAHVPVGAIYVTDQWIIVRDAWLSITFPLFVMEHREAARAYLRRIVTDTERRLFGAAA